MLIHFRHGCACKCGVPVGSWNLAVDQCLTHPIAALILCALSLSRIPIPPSFSVPLLSTQILPANVYVQQRVGSILSRSMILKADQFPSENLRHGLDLHVIGAPNFQQCRPYAIYATGQPSVSGSDENTPTHTAVIRNSKNVFHPLADRSLNPSVAVVVIPVFVPF